MQSPSACLAARPDWSSISPRRPAPRKERRDRTRDIERLRRSDGSGAWCGSAATRPARARVPPGSGPRSAGTYRERSLPRSGSPCPRCVRRPPWPEACPRQELLLRFLEQSITDCDIYSTQGSCDTGARRSYRGCIAAAIRTPQGTPEKEVTVKVNLISALVASAFLAAAPGVLAHEDGAEKLGTVHFSTSCSPTVQPQFERAVALLHSFWFDEGLKAFGAIAQADPGCAMAHWGSAMLMYGNPFAWPPAPAALAGGLAAVEKAKAAQAKTQRERDYIGAVEAFYKDSDKVEHRTRALAYVKAMEQLAQRYPEDTEASVFYALALDVTALPTDKTYANQLKAAAILEKVFAAQPDHPGVAHYLIHSYDYPPIAAQGLPAARRYASVAPSAAHALH